MRISKVGRIFAGETERHLLAPKNDYRRICSLRHKVGEIDPKKGEGGEDAALGEFRTNFLNAFAF